jgi:hypothetical protein
VWHVGALIWVPRRPGCNVLPVAQAPATPATPAAPQTPTLLRWAIRLIFFEAASLAVVLGLLVYADATSEKASAKSAALVTAYAAIFVAMFVLIGRGLMRRRSWARGPAVALHVLMLPLGYYMISGGALWLGIPAIAIGIAGLVMLLAPSTREALGIR